ncbi:MAG TPA: V-type ATP synthase subunit A [Methanospirillum sp.]|uniref:V-type ATP synthase subunit A n=1 Tax=Methanospirillum sp. TaxID=45200 RepID=UPI002C75741F|nr:V-type ATP synthase subunit A [Methanospirillum sp.]HOJ97529.1 V-type ATP synthase subunit A [Methanospirillum sp.]
MGEKNGVIIRVTGPVVEAEGMAGSRMYESVRVGKDGLIGEIIILEGDRATIQVYEETIGVTPGEPVVRTYLPLSVELGPGLVGTMYDGIQRPLEEILKTSGNMIERGSSAPALDRSKKYRFYPQKKAGDEVREGDRIGCVRESVSVHHYILVPPGLSGTLQFVAEKGEYVITDVMAVLDTGHEQKELTMIQRWPVRDPRPVRERLDPVEPLLTGQRIIDTLFPLARGGTAAIPGPFGSGKTVVQQQLAKWVNADIIVYIGCGERGNEMADVLEQFPTLKDPRTGHALSSRMVLIANTSNMPVAAREASVYTGITIAEYYRDMGYHVALMADSTSRWAEAMREISGRLEEMPGEEGYPAYLSSRLADFYERAGRVSLLGSGDHEGSISVIGAVSPPGGDFSEPVTQNTLRIVKVFWALDADLAYQRHFPAINWLMSYSLYSTTAGVWWEEHIGPDFIRMKQEMMEILQRENELEEIIRLVGPETLPESDRLLLLKAEIIRESFLMQYAFDEYDTFTGPKKQYRMLQAIFTFFAQAEHLLDTGVTVSRLRSLPLIELFARMGSASPEEEDVLFDSITRETEAMRHLKEDT